MEASVSHDLPWRQLTARAYRSPQCCPGHFQKPGNFVVFPKTAAPHSDRAGATKYPSTPLPPVLSPSTTAKARASCSPGFLTPIPALEACGCLSSGAPPQKTSWGSHQATSSTSHFGLGPLHVETERVGYMCYIWKAAISEAGGRAQGEGRRREKST